MTGRLKRDQDTILVIEDQVLVRMALSDYLRECGYRVIEAANTDEAVAIMQEAEVEFSVIFSAIDLAGALQGFSLAQWVRQHKPGVKVILAGNMVSAAEKAEDLCESGSMPKPYSAEDVLRRIKRLIAPRPDANNRE